MLQFTFTAHVRKSEKFFALLSYISQQVKEQWINNNNNNNNNNSNSNNNITTNNNNNNKNGVS